MKLVLVMIIVVCSTRSPVRASPGFAIELKGGADAATTTRDGSLDLRERYGLTGGLAGYFRWPLAARYTLAAQIESLYVSRGAVSTFEEEFVGKSRYRYFDIAVAARPGVRLGPAGFYLVLGSGLNLLMSAGIEDASGRKADITDVLHRVDVALLAGAGSELHLPHRRLGPFTLGTVLLEARYNHGLRGIDAVNGGFKNRTWSLMLGVSFALSEGASTTSPGSPPAE